MKLLVFEYSSVCLDNSLFSEGFNMLKCVLDDLDDSAFEVYYLINDSLDTLNYTNSTAIPLDTNLMDWLNENCQFYDCCLFIAPEDNLIQYSITRILEKSGVTIFGCDSVSSYICASKDLTYNHVSNDILKIPSVKLNRNESTYDLICKNFNKNDFIIKPDNRTSSDYIYHINDETEFDSCMKVYEKNSIEYFLAQEYIEGTPISASLICNNKYARCISINSQEISIENNKIRYAGCKSPIHPPLEKEITELSEKIVQQIKGLNGYVGIDYILQEKLIYFVEINSRISTPYIVLQKNCNQNLTQSIIDSIINKNEIPRITFKNTGTFKK